MYDLKKFMPRLSFIPYVHLPLCSWLYGDMPETATRIDGRIISNAKRDQGCCQRREAQLVGIPSMTAIEQQLCEALAEFMSASATRDAAKIGAALTRIEGLRRQLGDGLHPMLRHYLERRSYQKALDFLNSGRPETETPQCDA